MQEPLGIHVMVTLSAGYEILWSGNKVGLTVAFVCDMICCIQGVISQFAVCIHGN